MKNLFNLKAKNIEQKDLLKALFNPDIHLVVITGSAGSGKTLLATYAGLEQTNSGLYDKTIVSRPIIPMGKEIGFLPGTLEEKLSPWTQPIWDSIKTLVNLDKKPGREAKPEAFVEAGLLEIEALMYIRGRSIPNVFLLIDEAQNLSIHEIKTIITRAGEGTKVVLTGDPDQIDTKGLSSENNGLSYVAERAVEEGIARVFNLEECVRSPLASWGVTNL